MSRIGVLFRDTNMADEVDESHEIIETKVGGSTVVISPPRPPSPPVVPFKQGINLMKSPASLIGEGKGTSMKKSALDLCKSFVSSRFRRTSNTIGLSWFYYNNDIEACLQDGPTCGLVALKHAADILRASQSQLTLNKTSENEIAELLQLSIDSGFTYRGEMFSARDMGFLAKKYYDINYKVFGSGLKDYASLVNHLVQGYPVVVPYDSDRNNEPCLKKGHKAHWAVITGFLLGLEDESKLHAHKFDEVPLYPLKKARSSLPSNFESKDLFVIVRHGKSRHYGLWPWIDLYNSNNNLFEFDPIELENIEKSGTKKCVFTEGVQKGLCSKVLFFYPS